MFFFFLSSILFNLEKVNRLIFKDLSFFDVPKVLTKNLEIIISAHRESLVVIEAAELSCSWRNDDNFESISLFLLVGTTLVEFRGTEPAVPVDVRWLLLPWPLTNEIDFGKFGEEIDLLLGPPNYLMVFK